MKGAMPLTREELTALRDAIDMTLALPDSIREVLAQWLAPQLRNPTGEILIPLCPCRRRDSAKAKPAKPTPAQAAEQRLLEAMRDNPGLSVNALANAAGSSRSATGERLRQMALRGMVTKDTTGRWKLKEAEPGPQQPSPN